MDPLDRVGPYIEKHFLRRGIDLAVLEDETPQSMLVMCLVSFHRHRVLQIDPVVLVEIRIQCDANEPCFATRVCLQIDQLGQLPGAIGRKQFHLARPLGDEDSSVGGNCHLHPLPNTRGEHTEFQLGIDR